MDNTQSRMITYIAIAQFIPLLLFPWKLAVQSLIFIGVFVLLCGLLGWALITRKVWGRKLCIFTQGFNIIIRLLTLAENVYVEESGWNIGILVTYILSAVLSWVILSYIDKPEVQLAFEA